MEQQCWWFGINNAKKPRRNSHIAYSQIEPLFSGEQDEFEWPYHKQAKRFYEQMQPGDKVIFWMGDRGSYIDWGLLGFGFISDIRGTHLDSSRYILKANYILSSPITPYPSGKPQETEETRFLKDIFGLEFKPLGKTFDNLGYGTPRAVATIAKVEVEQFEAVFNRAKSSRQKILGSEIVNEYINQTRDIICLSEIPGKDRYTEAFQSLLAKNRLNDMQQAILSAQYWSPDHTAGAVELGNILDYNFRAINSQYGRLGHLLADEMDFQEIGTHGWWVVLAEGWRGSGGKFIWRMHQEVAESLEKLGWIGRETSRFAEQAIVSDNLVEGAVRQITVNSYERNSVARKKCIGKFGAKCIVCKFDFGKTYGPLGEGYIHVHHLKPLSEINESYEVDPIKDLRPVCPNCHAMIHRKNPPLSIEQVKDLLLKHESNA